MSRCFRLFWVLVLISVVAAGSFTAGYVTAQPAPNPPLVNAASGQDQQTGPEDFTLFWEAWNLIKQEYYLPDTLTSKDLTYGAIEGLLSSLGDAHTGFATPDLSQVADEDIRGAFGGVGVTVELVDGKVTVVAPTEGSPGEQAGIKAGDVILKVDGEDITALGLMKTVARIRGPIGTAVELTIERQDASEPLVFNVTRAEIKVESVKTEMIHGNIGYVKITSFSEPTGALLDKKLRELMAQQPTSLVLDLRNNPGGLLLASTDVASQFMPAGQVILYQQDRQNDRLPHYSEGGLATNIPMAVLINRGSASASEIVAGALQDSGRAKLVGEPTFGKDTVQNVHHLSDDSTVRVTIARWYTPDEQDIHEKGLKPELLVPFTETDYLADQDPQLDAAVEYLKTLAPATSHLPAG